MPVPNIIKIFQIIKELWSAQEFVFEIHLEEITRKKEQSKICQFFLHATLLLDLIYDPIKYYQIISKSMGVIACTRFWFQGRQLQ